jgi:hypothetical protein
MNLNQQRIKNKIIKEQEKIQEIQRLITMTW